MDAVPSVSTVVAQIAIAEHEKGKEDAVSLKQLRQELIDLGFTPKQVDAALKEAIDQRAIQKNDAGNVLVLG